MRRDKNEKLITAITLDAFCLITKSTRLYDELIRILFKKY